MFDLSGPPYTSLTDCFLVVSKVKKKKMKRKEKRKKKWNGRQSFWLSGPFLVGPVPSLSPSDSLSTFEISLKRLLLNKANLAGSRDPEASLC